MPSLLKKIARSPRRRAWQSIWRRCLHRSLVSGLRLGDDVEIGKGVHFETHRSLPGRSEITVGSHVTLEDYVRLETHGGTIEIKRNVHIGSFSVLYGHGGITIGEDTLVAMHCRILSSDHAVPPIGTPIRSQADICKPTTIGRDVWLGAGVTILGGITIGDGAVIGAGSVVTKDVEPGAICAGVPASLMKTRETAGERCTV